MTASPSITDELIRNADSLRALARDLLGDPALADDVVQQACVTAMVRPPGSRRDIPAWLRAVVRTCALDFRRAERRRRLREQSAAKPEAVEAGDGSPVDTAARIDLQQDILAAVRSLAEPYRTTVWLRYYEHLTPTEIAARVGQAVPTVKMRLWRALQLLRQRLDGRYGRSGWMAALAPLVQGPTATAGAGAALAAGALFMQTKQIAIAAAVVLLVLTGATLVWPSGDVAPAASGESSRAAAAESRPLGEAAAASPERRAVADAVPEVAAVVAPYGDLIVQVRWHDGTPAPGVAIVCHAEGEPQLDQNEVRVVAGEDGVARVAHLHAGDVLLTSDRGGKAKVMARVEAGGANAVEFVLPRGIDVAGTVTDDGRRPVAGARIFVASGGTGWLGGRTVAATDADGRFTLRSIDVRCSVGALGRGYAPSELIDLESFQLPADGAALQVHLRLARPGATVAGLVTDDRGEPVEGACVAIGTSRPPDWSGGAQRREFWSPDVATTDADGAFRCDGVAPGQQPIEVRASGHGTWRSEIECVAGELRTLAVTLPRAVTVRGVVRDTAGGVVAGAVVAVLATPADWQFQGGQRRWTQAFPWPETRSDAAGRFELQGVAPTAVHLLACKRAEPGRPHEGMCRETLAVLAGETIAWNPVLVLGKSIRVRLLDVDDEPGRPNRVGTLSVQAIAERAGPDTELLFGMLLDGTGERFVVSNCLDGPYTVSAQVVGLGQTVHAWQSGVLPDGPEIVLRLPPPPPQGDAIVRGRVVDSGRRVPAGKQGMVVLAANGSERRASCTDGRFEFQTVEAGSYLLLLQVDETRVFAGAPFTVQAAQVLDVGDLVTAPAASITVTLQAPAGLDLGNVRATLGHGPASRLLAWDGRALHADNVDAGKHRLTFWSTGWLARPRDVDLVAGQDNQIAVDVIAAAPRAMEILFPFPDRWRIGDVRVRDQAGEVVAECLGTLAASIGVRALAWKPSLPAGRYTVDATTDTGLLRSWPLDGTAVPAGAPVVRFSMR